MQHLGVLTFFAVLVELTQGQCSGTTTISNRATATDLAKCKVFDGDVRVESYQQSQLPISGISNITGQLYIAYGSNLSSVDADGLVSIGQELIVGSIDSLLSLHFSSLKSLGSLWLRYLPNLSDFTTASDFENVTSVRIYETALTNLDSFQPKYVDSLAVERNPLLDRVSLPLTSSDGYVSFQDNGPNLELLLPNLEMAYNLTISDCKNANVSSLAYVNRSLGLFRNGFQTMSLPRLLTANVLMIWNNTSLGTLEVPVLVNVTNDIIMSGNSKLASIDFPALSRVEGEIAIDGSFNNVSAPALTFVKGDVNIFSSVPLDCSTLDPYDANDVFRALYHCNGSSVTDPATGSSSNSSNVTTNSSGGLSGGAKGGIAAGIVVVFLLLVLTVFFCRRRRARRREQNRGPSAAPEMLPPISAPYEVEGGSVAKRAAELSLHNDSDHWTEGVSAQNVQGAELGASKHGHRNDIAELPTNENK